MGFLWALLSSFVLSVILTPVFAGLARRFDVVDKPDNQRKKHGRIVPYFGGLALVVTFLLCIYLFLPFNKTLWVILGGLMIVTGMGLLDDIYCMKPWQKLVVQLFVGIYLYVFGVGIDFLNLPFGEVFDFSSFDYSIAMYGYDLSVNIITAFITIFWTVLLMNSINFLDGMDGLAGGVSMIAFVVIFLLSVTSYVHQFDSAMMAIVMAGGLMGFLVYNLPKATVFLGDVGSLSLGYMMAVMSIISGSKLATVTLVLGIVLLDVLFVIYGRMKHGKKIWMADNSHLHHKLQARGWSQWKVLGLYYSVSVILGLLALYVSNSLGKILIGGIFFVLFAIIVLRYIEKTKEVV